MITSRGGWFLAVVLLTLAIGAFAIPHYSVVPALLGLTLLAWFVYEWTIFQARSYAVLPKMRVTRRVLQGGRDVPMVWAGLTFEVRVTLHNPSSVKIPFAVVEDRPAVATRRMSGDARLFTDIPPGGSIELVYELKAPAPGILRFEGVQVRAADFQGFFYRRVFLRDAVEFLVLPPLNDDEGRQRATKRFNTLPAPGIHRLRRPGSGSELLDLRDYRPGDPPKMIAWKASARRDRLITKEFENEVPVRCIIFLDITDGVRLGPPGNTLLTRLAGVAAVVAQASAANRDLVGLTTIDEREAKAIAPARTKIHTILVLRRLAEVCALQPDVAGAHPELLLNRAYPLAQELYPELMSRRVNTMTLGRLWIPLLDRKYGWIALTLVLTGFILFLLGMWGVMSGMLHPHGAAAPEGPLDELKRWVFRMSHKWFLRSVNTAAWLTPNRIFDWRLPFFVKLLWMGGMFVLTYFIPGTLALIFWFFHSFRGWFGVRKSELLRRKQLGALFALQDGTGVNGVERYVHDRALFEARVAEFLQQHQHRCPVPLYDENGRYRFHCAGKAAVLADAIVRAVGRARDNELYVVLADLAELGANLGPVVRACRVARSRHHHVLVIVPWPADVPSPDAPEDETTVERPAAAGEPRKKRPIASAAEYADHRREEKLLNVVRQSLTKQYHQSFRSLRRQLGKVGATVMRANDGDPVQMVLERLDRLRGMRSRR